MKQKLIQQNKYQDQLNFLYDLINDFTKKLKVDNRLFYFMVQRNINGTSYLRGFVYGNNGLSSNKEFDQAGPRPSAFLVHGVVGKFPP